MNTFLAFASVASVSFWAGFAACWFVKTRAKAAADAVVAGAKAVGDAVSK
jgi:hypothetical protein